MLYFWLHLFKCYTIYISAGEDNTALAFYDF